MSRLLQDCISIMQTIYNGLLPAKMGCKTSKIIPEAVQGSCQVLCHPSCRIHACAYVGFRAAWAVCEGGTFSHTCWLGSGKLHGTIPTIHNQNCRLLTRSVGLETVSFFTVRIFHLAVPLTSNLKDAKRTQFIYTR